MKTRILLPALFLMLAGTARAGAPLKIPAFYDGKLFTITFSELPPGGESAVEQRNGSINTIYMCDSCVDAGVPFTAVIDAIQGDGFNPLWEEHQITFNSGFTPHQFTSDTDVLAAASAGEITITDTDQVYVCAVLGPGPKNRSHK